MELPFINISQSVLSRGQSAVRLKCTQHLLHFYQMYYLVPGATGLMYMEGRGIIHVHFLAAKNQCTKL